MARRARRRGSVSRQLGEFSTPARVAEVASSLALSAAFSATARSRRSSRSRIAASSCSHSTRRRPRSPSRELLCADPDPIDSRLKCLGGGAYHGLVPELVFLAPEAAAGPAADLAVVLSEEIGRQDAASTLVPGRGLDLRSDRVFVLVVGDEDPGPLPELSRTIVVLLAPPGTDCFEQDVAVAREAGGVFHVNAVAVQELLAIGVPAKHLQLGYAPGWDRFDPQATREASIAAVDDLDALTRSQLAIVRSAEGYFDWPRALRAIHCGAVVLHERSLGMAPLLAGRHLFVAAAERLEPVAAVLLRDRERLDCVRAEALDFLHQAVPLELAAAALIGAARTLVAQPLPELAHSTPGQPALKSK